MNRGFVAEIGNLMPAGGTPGDHRRGRILRTNLRQKASLRDFSRNIEVLFGIAERSRHSAASRIEVNHSRSGDFFQQCLRRSQKPHRLLVTVAVQQYLWRSRLERYREIAGKFLKKNTGIRDSLRASLIFAS